MNRRRRLISIAAFLVPAALVATAAEGCPEDPPPTTTTTTEPSTTITTAPPATWPGPDNTGPTSSTLTPYTGAQVEAELAADGLVEHAAITGGNIDPPSGSTLRDFTLDAAGAPYGIRTINGQAGVTVEHGEMFGMTSTGGYGGGITYNAVDVHDSGGDAFKPRTGATIRNSWTHHLGRSTTCTGTDCPHGDGFQFDGPSGSTISDVHIVGNHCEAPWSFLSTQSTYHQQSCVQVNGGITVTGSDVTGNYLHGAGSFSVNCSPPGADTLLFADNTVSRDVHYGPNTGCQRWEGNHYEDGTPA